MCEKDGDVAKLDTSQRMNLCKKEIHEILDYYQELEFKRIEELKQQGIYKGGLDDCNQYLTDIWEERNRKVAALKDKYNL